MVADLVDLLERLATQERALDLADEREHRRRILPGSVDPDGEVGRSHGPRPKAHRRTAGQLPIGLGHERRPALVAGRDDPDPGSLECVEDAEERLTRHGEGHADTGGAQRLGDEPADGPRLGWLGRLGSRRFGGQSARPSPASRRGLRLGEPGSTSGSTSSSGLAGASGHRLRLGLGLDPLRVRDRCTGSVAGIGRVPARVRVRLRAPAQPGPRFRWPLDRRSRGGPQR